MQRNFALFLVTFGIGAIVAFATRAALHEPHAATIATAHVSPENTPMVSNALTPVPTASGSGGTHATHSANSSAPAAAPAAHSARTLHTILATSTEQVAT